LIGLDLHVTADVTYRILGGDGKVAAYPIKTTGSATFSDPPIACERMRIANERTMHQDVAQFLLALR
jgi:hypothetical protein